MKKEIKKRLLIWVPLVLLIVVVGFFGFDKYTSAKEQEQISIFERGVSLGQQQIILQMIQQAQTCQPIPLYAENVTVNMIAIECPAIQQFIQQTQQQPAAQTEE